MRKIIYFFAALSMTAGGFIFMGSVPAMAAVEGVAAGQAIYANGGKRLGAIYKTTVDGAAQVILDGKLVTIPASTITVENGKVETSMTRQELKRR